jgi:V-type H+-transporting ATPase subunit a
MQEDINSRGRLNEPYFDLLENEIYEEERKIFDLVDSYTKIKESLEVLIEQKCVFDKSHQLISSNTDLSQNFDLSNRRTGNNPMILEEGGNSGFVFLAGVIKAEDDIKMKRMIFRVSRGTALSTFFDFVNLEMKIKDSDSSPKIEKKIFTIFFQNGQDNYLLHKMLKICDLFAASRFHIPRRSDIQEEIKKIDKDITDKKNFLNQAESSIKYFLRDKIGNVYIYNFFF